MSAATWGRQPKAAMGRQLYDRPPERQAYDEPTDWAVSLLEPGVIALRPIADWWARFEIKHDLQPKFGVHPVARTWGGRLWQSITTPFYMIPGMETLVIALKLIIVLNPTTNLYATMNRVRFQAQRKAQEEALVASAPREAEWRQRRDLVIFHAREIDNASLIKARSFSNSAADKASLRNTLASAVRLLDSELGSGFVKGLIGVDVVKALDTQVLHEEQILGANAVLHLAGRYAANRNQSSGALRLDADMQAAVVVARRAFLGEALAAAKPVRGISKADQSLIASANKHYFPASEPTAISRTTTGDSDRSAAGESPAAAPPVGPSESTPGQSPAEAGMGLEMALPSLR